MNIGNFLFKIRSFTPLPVILAAIFVFPPSANNYFWTTLTGLLVAISGELLRILTVGYSRPGTSGRESFLRADELNTDGIYSLLRNPLYLGNIFIYFGLALVHGNLLLVLFTFGYFFLQYELIVRSEEKFLIQLHGDRFKEFCQKTNRWLPVFRYYRPPATSFNLQKVIFKEKDSLFNLFLLFFLIAFWRFRYAFQKKPPLQTALIILLPLFLLYLTINLLKKRRFKDGQL